MSKQATVVLSTRIPKKLKAKLTKLAAKKGCSLSQYVAELLSRKQPKKEPNKKLKEIQKALGVLRDLAD